MVISTQSHGHNMSPQPPNTIPIQGHSPAAGEMAGKYIVPFIDPTDLS